MYIKFYKTYIPEGQAFVLKTLLYGLGLFEGYSVNIYWIYIQLIKFKGYSADSVVQLFFTYAKCVLDIYIEYIFGLSSLKDIRQIW